MRSWGAEFIQTCFHVHLTGGVLRGAHRGPLARQPGCVWWRREPATKCSELCRQRNGLHIKMAWQHEHGAESMKALWQTFFKNVLAPHDLSAHPNTTPAGLEHAKHSPTARLNPPPQGLA